jgi:hypothetical protein
MGSETRRFKVMTTKPLNWLDGDWIQTFTGKAVFPFEPTYDMIDIEDIAHGLAMTCRYGGHTNRFFSVAEHCCHLYDWFIETEQFEDAFAALMHDAAEAYIGDVPRPIKKRLPEYLVAEAALEKVIFGKYGVPNPMPKSVKDADRRILADEKAVLLKALGSSIDLEPLHVCIQCWTPEAAEIQFLNRFGLHE